MQDGTLRPEAVVPLLRGGFGHPYLWRETCPSTQELARGLPEGGVAACEEQTAGRGRRGRSWISKRGAGVLFSLSLHPRTPPERLAPLTLVVAEAVAEAAGPEATVRWPNDVVAGGQKLAGILAEVRGAEMVVGIGVNANHEAGDFPGDARVPPVSLRLLRGGPVDRAALLADVLELVEARYRDFEKHGFTGLGRDDLRGRRVRLAGGGEGVCEGVDERGRLVVAGVPHTAGEVVKVELLSR
jgi:BirA family transcriptional regulator, biotin operon repressor / biotin---[acetyl-CoA-carboxylase] ligase